jgi:thioredoxin-dependent peroxiredoxin
MVKELDVGDIAPDFELPTDGGGRAHLKELKGKSVVIYFYPKDDTSGCTAQAIDFNGLRAKFAAAGATVIGVSPDSAASHDKFKHKHDLKIALAADPERSAIETYGVWKEKSMYGRK